MRHIPGHLIHSRVLAVAITFAAVTVAATATAAVTTTFDASVEGWTVTGDNAASWSSSGGNPDGCLQVNDLATGADNLSVAPHRYLGDWSAMGAGDSLLADVWCVKINGTDFPTPWLFRISGPGGAAHALGGLPPFGVWTRYRVSLSPSDWVMESGTWAALTANVTSLLVYSEFVTGNEDTRLDNIVLTADPVTVSTACVVETFNAAGLGAWSFANTGGATNPGTGGNTGGFCQVSDAAAGIGYAIAPPAFHGDWTPFEGDGRVTIDLRMVSAAGSAAAIPDFITLSGPGGSASVGLTSSDLPPSPRLWKHFEFPIRASKWTVTSGTWEGLLADVTEMRIRCEFYDGTDQVGIDNVARLARACDDPDPAITVLPVGPWLCGVTGFVGAKNVAHDPLTGGVYGIVELASTSGGGLWGVDGPFAGSRLTAYATPTAALFDPSGNAYISESTSGNINKRTFLGTNLIWITDGFHSGDDDPAGMCFAPPGFDGPNVSEGDVIVTDYGFQGAIDQIWSFSSSFPDTYRLLMNDPGNVDIMDVTEGPNGRVWFVDALDPDSLFSIGPSGQIAGQRLASPIPGMQSIAWDPVPGTGWLYVTSANALYRIHSLDNSVQTVATGFTTLDQCALDIDAANRRLWVADVGGSRVYEFCLPNSFTDVEATFAAPRIELAASPNPFHDSTRLAFALAAPADVRLEIFDLGGRRVRTLVAARFTAGRHDVAWDGRNDSGDVAQPGLYYAYARIGGDAGVGVRVVRIR